ncbi:MAG: hypothetical protein RLY61_901 [Candidatus Parcubacteria bacterium]|jgi:hypothetical protein
MLDYKYEILEVLPEQNNMMVKFTSEGRADVITGTPLPTEGTTVSDFLMQYAPIGYWLEQERKTFVPEVGHSGEFNAAEEAAKRKAEEEAMLAKAIIQNVEPALTQEQIEELIASLKK